MVGQPLSGTLDLEHLDRLGRVGVGVGGGDLVLIDRLPQLVHGVLVQGRQGGLLGGIVQEKEAPVLLVATGRGRMAASRMRAWTSWEMGSGRTRRIARVV